MAQRAQFFPSDDYDGNCNLNYDSANLSKQYDVSFDGFESILRPKILWWLGYNLKDGCNTIADKMMPLAILYTANLYQLFWDKTHPKIIIKNPLPSSYISGEITINGTVTNKEWIKDVSFYYSRTNEENWQLIGSNNFSSDNREMIFNTNNTNIINREVSIKAVVTAKNNKTTHNIIEVFVSPQSYTPTPPVVNESLKITNPINSEEYYTGQSIRASFSIKNNSSASTYLKNLTAGGRLNDICPNNICPDFDKVFTILNPGACFEYKGTLKLNSPGHYHFFIAYEKEDGSWNTNLPKVPGCENTFDINVIDPPQIISKIYNAKQNLEFSSPANISSIRPGDEIAFYLPMSNLCNFDWRNYQPADNYIELCSVDQY